MKHPKQLVKDMIGHNKLIHPYREDWQCPECDSTNVELDKENKFVGCKACGFWPRRTK